MCLTAQLGLGVVVMWPQVLDDTLGSMGPKVATPTASYFLPAIHACHTHRYTHEDMAQERHGSLSRGVRVRACPQQVLLDPESRRTLMFAKVSSGVPVSNRVLSTMFWGLSFARAT